MEKDTAQHAAEALHVIQDQLPQALQNPAVAIICGSGLGGLAESVVPYSRHEIKFADIPYFPRTTG
jgi:purine-nucleoside phosphorylase